MSPTETLYSRAVRISEDFLGPAGERFMRRQITTHLNIEPEQLQKKHLNELVEWIRLAAAVITSNAKLVNEFVDQILALDNQASSKSTARMP